MARDIEEFLRRAAERRQQQKQGGSAPPPAPPQAPPPQTPPSPILEKAPRSQYRQFPANEPIIENVEIVEERKVAKSKPKKRESVSEHVEKYLDTSDIKEKTRNLGSQVTRVSQEFDRNVRQNLNKDICSVDDGRASSDPKQRTADNSTAAKLKEMLARPETITQAILISEILNRPSFEDD